MGRSFDVIMIGAGPAGEVAAGRLAERGKAVAIVERELVGGECAYWACMPSKALLRPGELLAEVARVPGAAEALATRVPDAPATLRRRDEVVHDFSDEGQLPWIERRGIALLRGTARLAGERRVDVDGEDGGSFEAREAVIVATGSGTLVPPIPGLAEAEPWTTREATASVAVPERLVVLGGGVAGVELAQAWASLGARVTVV
jgi:pyruvate/2-oxoglutarate dehydrogenase complex dihydrolipoamide dehydrogenase (E3) component